MTLADIQWFLEKERADDSSRTPSGGLTAFTHGPNINRLKRIHLVLDKQLLDEVMRLSGQPSYSKAVDMALFEFVRRARAARIFELAGSGSWEGNLGAMRDDRSSARQRKSGRGAP